MQSAAHRISIPFRLRHRSGSVAVSMRPNDGSGESGHDLLDPSLDPAAVAGFPVITASIDYAGYGPRAWCGWLQVLHIERAGEPVEHLIDAINVAESGSPLYGFGYLPPFADAPVSLDRRDMRWRADTFLVAIPGVIGSRAVESVCGFSWGYEMRGGMPRLMPLAVTRSADWMRCQQILSNAYPAWWFVREPDSD